MKKKLSITVLVLAFNLSFSQVGIYNQEPKATLDIAAKTVDGSRPQGFIAPRLTGDQIKLSDSVFGSEQKGTFIYATSPVGVASAKTANITREGYYYFDGNIWQQVANSMSSVANSLTGDIKNSARTVDHSGWYLLNGRAISTLPVNAQAAASALGFTGNIPNAIDRVLKMQNASETVGSTGGTNTLTIARNNLPNISFTGTVNATADTAGGHTHSSTAGFFLLGGTSQGNNGGGHYTGHGSPQAWGGIGSGSATNTGGSHTHTVTGTTTVSTGGNGDSLDNRPAYLVVNTFMYLGE